MQAITLAALTLLSFGAGMLWTQEKPEPQKPAERFTHPLPKDPDGGISRWMQTMQPSAAHARLKELLGKYDTTTRIRMMPGQPPMESKGTAEFTWFAEGKWLQQRWEGDMFGRKAFGTSLLGYDNFKERYVTCFVDSLNTTLSTAFGHFERTGDDLLLWGTIDEPATPEQDKQVKYVYRGFGKDKMVFEVHDMMIGDKEETKVIEIEFVRRK